ncbi:PREDICTED: cytoskeleton-associated protein 5 [Nicrophorus vespilloides]|uniref:Cytoskeleton-associated protein 5 n=1 Tax=Nicrophorus vespilloides TaxID=110193 RepID=A0ABM1NEQ1_NICVS|nr:PREDICTED: cytoskeleton-associated protein 5 [Nicrophorus vespilloides]XP_017785301.1 PREDICTED: cytoskeleton-associated protein 5 [Nicrophorus vespilloides]
MEDDEFKKLPIEERCVHKLWKARVNGYEEVTKLFRQIDDEKSPEFAKYLGLVKKFVTDSNAMGQEKGLEATLAFVENYVHAGKTVGEVMSGIVAKCIAAPKTKTRELALQVTLMYIEIEKQDNVVEELIKGMELKNPKIVAACLNAATTGLREFGSKVIGVKPLVKKIPVLFADRDKNVRDEARFMVVEMYRWIGGAFRSQLTNLQPVQVAELEAEFSKVEGQKAVPTRYIKSQQEKQAKLAVQAQECDDVAEDVEDEEDQVVIDPYEIADPVDILSKLPKDFYDKLEAKKWQERKEALEALDNLLKAPKLESGDYGDMIRAVKKIIQKDSNVIVVALAARCMANIASGLKKRFQSYASACIPALLEKFKEKKQNVVTSVRDAADAVYLSTTLENVLEDVIEALTNKNPSVKSETALFLARSLSKTLPAVLNKKLLKAITTALIKLINEPDPGVRDSSAEALGTLMKLVGEKAVGPFLIELEKDALKMSKIKECAEKAVIVVKVPGAKKERPVTAPPKAAPKAEPPKASSAPAKSKRPATAAKKKPSGEISSGTATIVKSKGGKASNRAPSKPVEREMSDEEVAEIVADILSAEITSGLTDANWKNRLNAVEQFLSQIQTLESSNMPTQALVKTISKKPGLKDTNFQVLKLRLDVVKYLAENGNFSITTAGFCTNEITEKLGDAKNGTSAGDALTAIAEATSLSHVSSLVMDFAFTQKSPKVLQEAIGWMGNAIKEFGFTNLNAKYLIENAKKALASNNASVRSSAITFFGVLYLYMGPNLHMFLENEKPALREQINQEFDKHENEKPPAPTRGIVKSASSNSLDAEEDEEAGGDAPVVNLQDLLPRVDISSQISEALINEMADKNWKVRNEALVKVSNILTEAKLIKPNIGDLPQALALRLVDSNSKIAQIALTICENIATSMGPPCKQHIRTLFPGFLQGLGDGKAWIRSSSVNCMNAFGDQCGYKDFFEGEMVGDALKGGSPTLRCELWAWLAEKLPKIKSVPKEEMVICIPYLFSNMEDRNADVRKNANEAVLGIMIHVGYESMAKQLEKLKPGSKTVIMAALEKARPNLPAKPVAKKKEVISEEKAVRGTRPVSTNKNAVKPRASTIQKAPARKKEEDVDMSPLLAVNNFKHQRTIDEAKLKVLKWNFTTPREEFVDLLKDQMTTANVNKTLLTNMFHSDFKFHIKAIESLVEDLHENSQALISNLDLILKWLTLRFFDTNPSVLLKGLEYLHTVFNMLIENQYQLLDNEASSFIPYLILKIGDPKDAVRNGVKSLILKQIGVVYSMSKIFSYLMDGVKSKNARQRAECLDTMAAIIPDYGISVCLPSPAACLKEIAKQISDRDNSVRNAALNFAVQAYYIVGDKVYKMVGNISDKDMSLLEERIKRASKKPPPVKAKLDTTHPISITNMSPVKEHNSPAKSNSSNAEQDMGNGEEDIEEEDEEELPGINLPTQVVQPEPVELPGPYRLDPDHIKELDSLSYKLPELKLQKFDLGFLNEPIKMPTIEDARAKVMPLSPPKPILPSDTFISSTSKTGDELLLEKAISQVTAADYTIVNKSLEQIQEILQSSKSTIMLEYEDKFMNAIVVQLKRLAALDPRAHPHVLKMYRCILTVIDSFYVNKSLGLKVNIPVFKEVLNQFIIVLVDGKLEECPNGDAYIRVVNLNCVKIIERSDHTTVLCGLVQLLYGCIKNSSSPRLTELVMKCLWRVIKLLPNWAAEIDYDSVLLEVHLFLKDFPTAWWKTKAVDTPLRTVKTVIHSMAKIKGASIMIHLTKVPNTNDSEMETYMLKLLKSLKIEEVKAVPLKTDSGRRSLSRSTHTQLTEIFQKIGSKEETTEGLVQLYDFQQQNPEADIEPFLKKSSQFFQEYIQKNLKEIETSRKRMTDSKIKPSVKINNDQQSEGSEQDADYYRGRLSYWMKVWDEKLG